MVSDNLKEFIMIIIIFSTLIGIAMFVSKYKEYRQGQLALDEANVKSKFTKFDFSKKFMILYAIFAAFGLISALYGVQIKDEVTIAMGIVILFLFLGEFLICSQKFTLYYNDSAFFTKGTMVNYRSIDIFEKIRNIKFAFVKVRTVNGYKVAVSPNSC